MFKMFKCLHVCSLQIRIHETICMMRRNINFLLGKIYSPIVAGWKLLDI